MKTLYESILGSTGTGKYSYDGYIIYLCKLMEKCKTIKMLQEARERFTKNKPELVKREPENTVNFLCIERKKDNEIAKFLNEFKRILKKDNIEFYSFNDEPGYTRLYISRPPKNNSEEKRTLYLNRNYTEEATGYWFQINFTNSTSMPNFLNHDEENIYCEETKILKLFKQ